MCRLYGFRANELTKVECTLVRSQNALLVQSRGDASGGAHAGGWGIACYGDLNETAPCFPELVRHKTAVFDSDHFSHHAELAHAHTVLAHVRLATVGYVGTMNSHPFSRDSWTFAHNGTIPNFEQLKDMMEQESGKLQDTRYGGTDSEQLFLWLLSRAERSGIDLLSPDEEKMEQSLIESLAELDRRVAEATDEPARLTFILTNGLQMFACRFNNPLFRLIRKGVHDCEICGIPHIRHDDGVDYRAVLFASERITSESWNEVENYTMCAVRQDDELSVKAHDFSHMLSKRANRI